MIQLSEKNKFKEKGKIWIGEVLMKFLRGCKQYIPHYQRSVYYQSVSQIA